MGRRAVRRSTGWGAAATATAVAGACLAARALRPRRSLLPAVAAELRTPLLYLPADLTTTAALKVGRKMMAQPTKIRPGVRSATTLVPGPPGASPVPVVTYERPGRGHGSGALLWIHGGGMVMGTAQADHAFCSRVADELGLLVVSVDYRLAPEHPFPAGLDDCTTALAWLHDEAERLGVDPGRIAVGGASAGGGLAASLAQRARDEAGPAIAFQLLVYPMLDDRTVLRAEATGTDALIWSRRSNRFAWTAYLGHEPTLDDERRWAAPARTADLAGLPPAWIGVGSIDLFHDEDVDYAGRLDAAGVPCELHVVPGMFHGADAALATRPTMVAFRDEMMAALAAGVAPPAA